MKKNLILALSLVLTPALLAESPAEGIKAAARKLADAGSYSWTSTSPGQDGRGGMSIEGKTEKGTACLKWTFGDRTSESIIRDGKAAVKTDDGWKSGEEIEAAIKETSGGDGQRRGFRGAMAARIARTFKAPAAEAETLAAGVKELKKDGDTFSGDLTEEAAKERLSFSARRRGGDGNSGGPPTPTNAKGSVMFWIKDGALAKYEVTVSGTFEFNGESRDIKRTTTTEIKDAGSTKLDIPSEAAAKLPAAGEKREPGPEQKEAAADKKEA